jgi:hypothetical protein
MMGRHRLLRALIMATALCSLSVFLGGGANAALVKVGDLVLHADGYFKPSKLPKHDYAPVDLYVRADIHLTPGQPPPPLVEVNLDFDKDGLLFTKGLGVCPPERIAHATTAGARSKCASAIVGEGRVGAFVEEAGIKIEANEPGTLFNGPKLNGNPTVVGHVHSDFPVPRTYVVVIPIERRTGAYAYRAHIEVPKIAEGGVISHVDGKISRRFKYKGKTRSYVSAKCTIGVLRIHGHFLFADEDSTIIDGAIEKPCFPEE